MFVSKQKPPHPGIIYDQDAYNPAKKSKIHRRGATFATNFNLVVSFEVLHLNFFGYNFCSILFA